MILVVDDERPLADMLVEMLALIGRRAMAVYSAEEAMEVLHKQEPALIVSDVVMPGADGVELAIQARRLWPEVKILLISGNAATQEIVDSAHAQGHTFELLAKPVPPKDLLLKIAGMLSGELNEQQQSRTAGAKLRK